MSSQHEKSLLEYRGKMLKDQRTGLVEDIIHLVYWLKLLKLRKYVHPPVPGEAIDIYGVVTQLHRELMLIGKKIQT